jgi:GNAT superfamily N-acetyltransferase
MIPVINISKATLEDESAVLRLLTLLFRWDLPDEELDADWFQKEDGGKKYFRTRVKDGAILIARAEGKVIAYLAGGIHPDQPMYKRPRHAFLHSLYVDEPYRRKRVATRLVEAFVKWFEEEGATRAKVHAKAKHPGTIALYKSFGFDDDEVVLVRHSKSEET